MSVKPDNAKADSKGSTPRRQKVEVMTLLLMDMAGSTQLKEELGNVEALNLIEDHHTEVRGLLREYPDGIEVETAGDSFFLAFSSPSNAVRFALQLQASLRRRNRAQRQKLLDRIGIHVGEVMVDRSEDQSRVIAIHGLEVDKCARVMSLGDGGRILLTGFAFDNARAMLKRQAIAGVGKVFWVSHGYYELKGVTEPIEVCEVAERGATSLKAPADSEKAHRLVRPAASELVQTDSAKSDSWLVRLTARRQFSARAATWGAGIVALTGVLALMLPIGRPLADASYDLAFLLRRIETPPEAVVVRMDRESHDALNQPWMQPWDRRIHAALIDRMKEFKAGGMAFDVLFDQPAKQAGEDEALVSAARSFGKVAVAGVVNLDVRSGVLVGRQIEGPFPTLREVARWGLANKADSDSAIRRPIAGTAEKASLAIEAARLVAPDVKIANGSIWLNYYGPPGTIESFPYSQVLSNLVPAEKFAGKLVVVGAVYDIGYSGGRGTDDFKTPYSRWGEQRAPGVEITAISCLNLLRGDWLRRFPPWLELGIVIGLGMGAGFGLSWMKPRVGATTAVIGALLIAVGAMSAVWWTHVWFPWLIVCAVQIPVAVAWSVVALPSSADYETQTGRWRREVDGTTTEVSAPGGNGILAKPKSSASPEEDSDSSAPTLKTETTLSIPNYLLIRQIGHGAYGEVWLARDAIGQYRAMKIVHRRSFGDAAPYDREFEGIRQFTPISLRHPGLIQVLHIGRDDEKGFFYYIMEAADDCQRSGAIEPDTYAPRSLDKDLLRQGHLDASQTVRLGLALCDALGFLHSQRLIHRDIKPANTLFVRGQPKLGDIGLVTAMTEKREPVSYVGTKGYMPLEGPGAASADIYSLGKLLYVAAMGLPPSNFPELPPGVESRTDRDALLALNKVLLLACEPEAELRYPTAEALRDALRGLNLVSNSSPAESGWPASA